MQSVKSIFIRNDDIRSTLDQSLIYLTDAILSAGLCVSHAVEPANVSAEVAEWLILKKEEHPDGVEIIQHGVDHKIKTKPPIRGEFGGSRGYMEQLLEIEKGCKRMDQLFGNQWSRVFSFPYGSYNMDTIRALQSLNYRIISTGMRFSYKRRILNAVGKILRKKSIGKRNIVYTNQIIPGTSIYEIPVVLNCTKTQTALNSAIQKNTEELISSWRSLPAKMHKIGLLCHHRFYSQSDIDQLAAFLQFLRNEGVTGSRIEE